jgi:hypothetical protein
VTEDLRQMPPGIDRARNIALVVGGIAAAACLVGAMLDPLQFFRSYLWSYVFWVGIPLGCLAIVMLQHLTGGRWGISLRRVLEAGTRTLPLLAFGFVPILVGKKNLYVWTNPEIVAADPLLLHKAPYLNVPFFVARTVVYFVLWIGLAYLLNRWSKEQDASGDPRLARRLQGLSGPGLAVYVLTVTFASVDWLMSLEPHWFSTLYGGLLIVGQALGALALCIGVVILLARYKPLSILVTPDRLQDLGKLMLAFVMVWAYFAFSQFLIIWAGNLPEEIPWYLRRIQGGWQWAGLALVVLHFVLPFLLLLSRSLKRTPGVLGKVALLVVVMRLVDMYWTTAPAFGETWSFHWLDVAAPVALGGVWVAAFLWQLARWPLLPIGDPYLKEALDHAGH